MKVDFKQRIDFKIHYFKAFLKDFPRVILFWNFAIVYYGVYFIVVLAVQVFEYTKWIGWLGAAFYPLNFVVNLILPDYITGPWNYQYHLMNSILFLLYALLVPFVCTWFLSFVTWILNFIPMIDRFKHRDIFYQHSNNQEFMQENEISDETGEFLG